MTDSNRAAVDKLTSLLTLDEVGQDLFRAPATHEQSKRLFGGQVVAQALSAASRSTDPARPAHSLHAYFLRPGDPMLPVEFQVMRDFDGRSFANRRVVAMQEGTPILNLTSSFQRREPGLTHQAPMPTVPPPDQCPDFAEAFAETGRTFTRLMTERFSAFEMRPVLPAKISDAGIPAQHLWFRLNAPQSDPAMARVLLTYFSDFALLTTSVAAHPIDFFSPKLQAASLDHAVWFHADPPVDKWLLYSMDSPWAGAARGFARGMVFDASGQLFASMTQEGMIRLRED